MAGPWEKYKGSGIQTKPGDPYKVPAAEAELTGKTLSNVRTEQQIGDHSIERTGRVLSNQKTAQEIGQDRTKLGLELKTKFEALPAVKTYREALPQLASAMSAPDNAQGDLAVVYAFAKAMDPGSVVREGEMDMARGSSPLLGQLQSMIGMVNNGKRLPPDTRKGLIEAMRVKTVQFNRAYSEARRQYGAQAEAAGFNPVEILGDHDGDAFRAVEEGYKASLAPQPASFVEGDTRVERDPKVSKLIDTLVRQRVPYNQARQRIEAAGGVPGDVTLEEYNAAIDHARKNPGYKGSYGEATKVVPNTIGNKIGAAIDNTIGSGDLPGIAKGFIGSWDRAANMAESALNAIPGVDLSAAHDASARHQDFFKNIRTGEQGEMMGRLGGAALFSAPLKSATLAGGLGNLLMTDSSGVEAVKDAAVGAAGGKVADVALRAGAQLIAPQLDDSVRNLAREGAQLTPGRFFPALKKAEDLISSYPLVGKKVDDALDASVASVNRIPANRALGRIGQQLPEDIPAGHKAVEHTGNTISDFYNRNLAGTQAALDPTFITRLNFLGRRSGLRPQELEQFDDIVQREVGGAFMKGRGAMSGRDFKRLDERLGSIASKFQASPDDPYKVQLGESIDALNSQLHHLMRRQNPGVADNLRKADDAWADYSVLRRAAAQSPEDGIATPGQFRSAVRQNDNSRHKSATARGNARMQDFASDASQVIPATRGNSGTADRQNVASPKAWALGAGLSPLYSEPVLSAINVLAKRTADPASEFIANLLRSLPRGAFGAGVPLLVQPGSGN